VVLVAVAQSGQALSYASKELQGDKDLGQEAADLRSLGSLCFVKAAR